MICPSCKCEYRAGVTQCSDCGVPLVDALEAPTASPHGDGGIVSIWAGNDPGECVAVKEALEKAKIPFTDQASTGYFIFPSMRLKMEIGVSIVDRDKARKVLLDLEGRVDPTELTPEEIESLALPVSDDVDEYDRTITQGDVTDDGDDEESISDVWHGEKEDFATTLVACLRENGIPSRKLAEGSGWRLVVRPEHQERGKEIVREVVEAIPPK